MMEALTEERRKTGKESDYRFIDTAVDRAEAANLNKDFEPIRKAAHQMIDFMWSLTDPQDGKVEDLSVARYTRAASYIEESHSKEDKQLLTRLML